MRLSRRSALKVPVAVLGTLALPVAASPWLVGTLGASRTFTVGSGEHSTATIRIRQGDSVVATLKPGESALLTDTGAGFRVSVVCPQPPPPSFSCPVVLTLT